MTTVSRHLKKFPKARPSTLEYLAKREAMTKRIREEIRSTAERKGVIARIIDTIKRWI